MSGSSRVGGAEMSHKGVGLEMSGVNKGPETTNGSNGEHALWSTSTSLRLGSWVRRHCRGVGCLRTVHPCAPAPAPSPSSPLTFLQELANPELAPTLDLTPAGTPVLTYPHQGKQGQAQAALPGKPTPSLPATTKGGSGGQQPAPATTVGGDGGAGKGGAAREGRTRVWGHVALARQRAGEGAPRVTRNRFADVALRWTQGLLREVCVTRREGCGGAGKKGRGHHASPAWCWEGVEGVVAV